MTKMMEFGERDLKSTIMIMFSVFKDLQEK